MENLYENGYIFQRVTSSFYRGVDGDNWYLNYCSDNSYFEEFRQLTLNENGLFATYEEAEAFLKQREELEKATTEYIYEKGDYVIYKLTEVEV